MHPEPGSGILLFELYRASQWSEALVRRELRRVGVEPHLFGLLTLIRRHAPVAPSTIVAAGGIPATTLRDNVERLVRRGLVRRRPNPADGRSYLIELTPAGLLVFDVAGPVFADLHDRLAASLERPLAEYEAVLVELREGVRELVETDPRGRAIAAR
jgi:DNA-binding MarR family transcriptional regulator